MESATATNLNDENKIILNLNRKETKSRKEEETKPGETRPELLQGENPVKKETDTQQEGNKMGEGKQRFVKSKEGKRWECKEYGKVLKSKWNL